jgi:hypothetical protein
LDAILRFVYPGVDLPKFTDLSTLSALLSAADKYDIASMRPILKDALKSFLPRQPFRVYIVACQFGFLEEAKAAARVASTDSFLYHRGDEDLRHISSIDLLRLFQFVLERERRGWLIIEDLLGSWRLDEFTTCEHGEDAKDFYFHLAKAVEDAFVDNPCIKPNDLFAVLDKVPDPPPGCDPPPMPAEYYYEGGDEMAFNCPFQPMTIRNRLTDVAEELDALNNSVLHQFFANGIGGG